MRRGYRPLPLHLVAYMDSVEIGGAEISLGNLLSELDPSIEVTVLGVDQAVVEQIASRRNGSSTTTVPPVQSKWDGRRLVEHLRAMRSLSPDLVHVNLQSPWEGQYGILAGLLSRVPVVAVEQIVFGEQPRRQRFLRRALCSRLSAHIAVGERAAREVEEMIGLEPGSVETIYNGVPDLPANPVTRPVEGPVVGAAGRLVHQKGFDLLLRAVASLPIEATCVLVGDGPERDSLEQLAESLGLKDRLIVIGWTDRVRDQLASLDVVALPSRFEGFPLVAIEAMLVRRPLVVSRVQSLPEAVADGVTGIVIPPEDVEALASALLELLNDPGGRKGMGERGRARALERFTSTAMARSYEALYHRLLPAWRAAT
jgi:glycosyltransferase involved in cell wall biosynthesis